MKKPGSLGAPGTNALIWGLCHDSGVECKGFLLVLPFQTIARACPFLLIIHDLHWTSAANRASVT
jgi:hypothetical protein